MTHRWTTSFAALAIALTLAAAPPARGQTYRRGTGYAPAGGQYALPYTGGYYNEGRGTNNWYYDYYRLPRTAPYTSGYRGQRGTMTDEDAEGAFTDEEGAAGRTARTLSGEVLRTKRVPIRGTDTQVLAALVRTDSGRRVVADLGPVGDLRDEGIELARGDEIRARGFFTQVGGRRVFLTSRLTADGQTINVQRPRTPSRQRLEREGRLARGGEEGEEQESRYNPEGRGEREPGELPTRSIRGRVMQTRRVQLPGLDHRWLVALVRGTQGRQYLVNLGPEDDLENMDLSAGDQVSCRGTALEMAGRLFLLADRVRAHGQTVRVNQEGQDSEPESRQFRGRVVRTRRVRLPGLDQPLLFARVRTDQGRQFLVNLGPEDELENVELNQGDRVTIRGLCLEVDGQQMCLAQTVRANGHTVQINE